MAKELAGIAECEKDGKFDYRGYYIHSGEVIVGDWNVLRKNFSHAEIIKGEMHIYVVCPICKQIISA